MGEYFHYVNHDKKHRFCIGNLGGADKFSGIGRNLGGRAFCLLLTRSSSKTRYEHTWVGSWIGDIIECVGDYSTLQDEYYRYKEVTANIVKILYQVDGAEDLIEVARKDNQLFIQITHLIITNTLPEILPDFEEAFGKQWGKRYKGICTTEFYLPIFNII